MRAGWLVALAAGAAIGMAAPTDVAAQGNSNRARQQQELQRQRQQAREQARREAERKQQTERERLRRQQQQEANRAGLVLRRNDDYERARRERERRERRNDPWDIILGRDGDRRDRDDRYDPRDGRYDSRGPAFCRSGEGHPVKGRQWCRDKGFGLGRDRSRDIWGDIIYRDRRYDHRRLSRSTLGDILGSVVLDRFDSYGRTYYGNGTLNGRWLDDRASVLQLFMGSVPIARLIDSNRDGRVDNVSLLR
ncbi:MAG TPA: hypothetical protein VK912_16595 [Longimicrobiales bacterium]|nr:hypothetical protein [Longimicrobiales bacterium]